MTKEWALIGTISSLAARSAPDLRSISFKVTSSSL